MSIQEWEKHISFDRVLELHMDGIHRFGGSSGMKSRDCVEGSLGSAWSAQLYMEEDRADYPFTFACYLFIYITKNHCFEDGNKRLGWYVLGEVLDKMGLALQASDDEATAFVLELAANNRPDYEAVQKWISERLIASPNAEV